jgi:hypothetical protein
MGYEQSSVTVQGFRSTASTLIGERGCNPDWIEKQVAHGERDDDGAFNYTAYRPQRKVMMQEWGDYLDLLRGSGRSGILPSPDTANRRAGQTRLTDCRPLPHVYGKLRTNQA